MAPTPEKNQITEVSNPCEMDFDTGIFGYETREIVAMGEARARILLLKNTQDANQTECLMRTFFPESDSQLTTTTRTGLREKFLRLLKRKI